MDCVRNLCLDSVDSEMRADRGERKRKTCTTYMR